MQNLKQPKEENQQQQQTKHKFEATQRRKCINKKTQNTNLKHPKKKMYQQQQQAEHKSEVTHRRKCINNSKQITKCEATQRRKRINNSKQNTNLKQSKQENQQQQQQRRVSKYDLWNSNNSRTVQNSILVLSCTKMQTKKKDMIMMIGGCTWT